jgi:hypothetical protein
MDYSYMVKHKWGKKVTVGKAQTPNFDRIAPLDICCMFVSRSNWADDISDINFEHSEISSEHAGL